MSGWGDKETLLRILRQEGIHAERVLSAIDSTPRELFVSPSHRELAYDNTALPIDNQQTISQPYIVAEMTQLLVANGVPEKVLEIGTGSGYQAAVLSCFVSEVYTVERIHHLYEQTRDRLANMGYRNVAVHYGDGWQGWSQNAPYGGIIVTAACRERPEQLLSQLDRPGRMVAPMETDFGVQYLTVFDKTRSDIQVNYYDPVMFVPLRYGQS